MELWEAVGAEWDRAVSGDVTTAFETASRLLDSSQSPDDRAVLLAFRAFCELTGCDYLGGAQTAEAAALESPTGELARFYVDAVRLLAAGMVDQGTDAATLPLSFDEVMARSAAVLPLGADAQLAVHPLIEAAMATGRFVVVEQLVNTHPATGVGSSTQVGTWVRLQLIRSQLFRGQLPAVVAGCAALESEGALARHPQAAMVANALLCYAAAQSGDRVEVDARSTEVLAEARRVGTYVQVGSCLLVAWSFSTIGQVQRAAALLLGTAGGAGLVRIKTWDRAFGYELLASAALQRGDLAAAREWAAWAAPLARYEVAAAAVERTLSRVAAAEGNSGEALARAIRSAAHDSATGSRIDELRSRVLVAGALAARGEHGEAIANLGETAREAERLGADAVRREASRELRALSDRRGGWESLTDREREIAVLAAEGHSNRTIASTLFISDRTVQSHVSRALRALGVDSRTGIPSIVTTATRIEAPPLTERQQQVARLVASGMSNAAIAAELGISAKTVEKHLSGIFERWGVSSRTAIATRELARS